MNRTALSYHIGLRLLGALWPLFLLGLTLLGAYLYLRDLASLSLTWIAEGRVELSEPVRLGLLGAVILAVLLVSMRLVRHCTRWHRRYFNIDEVVEFDPETRVATTYNRNEDLVAISYWLVELGPALLVAALVANALWGEVAATVFGVLGIGLTGLGIGLLVFAAPPAATSRTYYPGTLEFNALAAQYAVGSEERDHLAAELAKIPPSNIDYPMAQKMLESWESGADLGIERFGFGLPPGTEIPPGPDEQPERIG